MRYQPEYPKELTPEEVAKLKNARAGMTRSVLPLLGMAKTVASKLPASFIEERLDGDWLMRRANEKFPVLAERVKAHGEKGRQWLSKQAREIALFLTGKLYWDDKERRLVEKGR